jgi:hypothetical protein
MRGTSGTWGTANIDGRSSVPELSPSFNAEGRTSPFDGERRKLSAIPRELFCDTLDQLTDVQNNEV